MTKYRGPPRLKPYRNGDPVPWRANSIEHLPLASIKPNSGNARKHDRKQIDKLFRGVGEFGFTTPILIDENGRIIADHARFEAAKRLGMSSVPCIRVSHLTEPQKKALAIADNALTDASSWDETAFRAVLLQLDEVNFDLDLTGLDTGTVDFSLDGPAGGQQADPADTFDPVDPVDSNQRAVSRRGFLWHLGHHRVFCGDALNLCQRHRTWPTQPHCDRGGEAGRAVRDQT